MRAVEQPCRSSGVRRALAPTAAAAHADDGVTLRMAHQWPDDPNDYVVSTGKQFAAEVEKRSGGKMHIKIFPADSLVKAAWTRTPRCATARSTCRSTRTSIRRARSPR